MRSCRILQDPARSGSLNMAIDEAILRHADQESRPLTTLRLYRWQTPTVSVGYAQHPQEAANLTYCAEKGIDIVRRPTGGRAVLHAGELTYAVVSNDLELFGGSGIRSTYLVIARVLQQALQRLGCPAEVSPGIIHRRQSVAVGAGNRLSAAPSPVVAEPCFLSTSRFEITAGGRKLVGSAQRRLKRAFLQHGSILIRCDYDAHAAALGADATALRRSLAGVENYVALLDIESSLRRVVPECLQEILGISAEGGELEQEESLTALHYEQMGRHRVIGVGC